MRLLLPVFASFAMLIACGSDAPPDDPTPNPTPTRDSGARDTGTIVDSGVVAEPDSGAEDSGGPTCSDPNDLGGEDSPSMLPGITDKDATPRHKVNGIAAGPTDIDVFTFFGTDDRFSVVDLRAGINVNNVEFCAFVKCQNGVTKPGTCKQGTAATNAFGNAGCCGSRAVEFDWNCGGVLTGESANVFMRVKPLIPMCTPYTIEYTL